MGHAGAFASLGEDSAEVKAKALADAGVAVVNHPSKFGSTLHKLLADSGREVGNSVRLSKSACCGKLTQTSRVHFREDNEEDTTQADRSTREQQYVHKTM